MKQGVVGSQVCMGVEHMDGQLVEIVGSQVVDHIDDPQVVRYTDVV